VTKFKPLTRGGVEYKIYEIYPEQEYAIHGAMYTGSDWEICIWTISGSYYTNATGPFDLIPLPQRRMKTLAELAKDYSFQYNSLDNTVRVRSGGRYLVVSLGVPAIDSLDDEWLNIFTMEVE
jgi:hypothetical protein